MHCHLNVNGLFLRSVCFVLVVTKTVRKKNRKIESQSPSPDQERYERTVTPTTTTPMYERQKEIQNDNDDDDKKERQTAKKTNRPSRFLINTPATLAQQQILLIILSCHDKMEH